MMSKFLLIIIIFGIIIGSFKFFYFIYKRNKIKKIHKNRCRRIYGCLKCGKEILPGKEIFVCGECLENREYCKYHSKIEHLEHKKYKEIVPLEVDPNKIKNANSIAEIVQLCFKIYKIRPCLGFRKKIKKNIFSNDFSWLSYKEIGNLVENLSEGLINLVDTEEKENKILLIGESTIEWFISIWGILRAGLISIPLHPSISKKSLKHIIKLTNLKICILQKKIYKKFKNELKGLLIIFIDSLDSEEEEEVDGLKLNEEEKEEKVKELKLQDIYKKCKNKPKKKLDKDIVMLLPTSGTTGLPKLTIVTESMLRHQAIIPKVGSLLVILSYEPMKQSIDILCKGGRIGVFTKSIDNLIEDLKILRPTIFGATPLFWNHLFNDYLNYKGGDKSNWFNITKPLGNRCKVAIISGSKSSKKLKNWIFKILGCIVLDGYGTTETGGLIGNNEIMNVNIQLIDCPELGYLTTDNPPRGEILANSSRMTPGYYNDPESTKESFIEISGIKFFKTGDIGELSSSSTSSTSSSTSTNQIKVIDRISSIIKLSQGIKISPEKLENLFLQSKLIKQIWIYGNFKMSNLISVVIPTSTKINKEDILNEFRKIAIIEELNSWEIPQKVFLSNKPFSTKNFLLSSIGKLNRFQLLKKYKKKFKLPNIVESKEAGGESNNFLNLKLINLLKKIIPDCPSFIPENTTLQNIGADSIAISLLSRKIKEEFNVKIPYSILVKLKSLIHLQLMIYSNGIQFENSLISDIDFKKEVNKIKLNKIPSYKFQMPGKIFLTGSTGFFGGFILKELLKYNFKIVCLVRGSNERLFNNLKKLKIFKKLKNIQNIEFINKDLIDLNINDLDNYNINLIIHNASIVNSSKTYNDLYNINVLGTKKMIEISSIKNRSLIYISTIGFLGGESSNEDDELSSNHLKYLSGYAQSKWVADQLVQKAFKLGLKGCIIRPGTIFGHSKTGSCNLNDSIISIIKSMLYDRKYCLNEDSPLPQKFSLVPVNYCSKIVRLSIGLNGIFHLINPNLTSLKKFVKAFNNLKINLINENPNDFRKRMENCNKNHPLYIISSVLSNSSFLSSNSIPNNKRLINLIGLKCPKINSLIIENVIKFLINNDDSVYDSEKEEEEEEVVEKSQIIKEEVKIIPENEQTTEILQEEEEEEESLLINDSEKEEEEESLLINDSEKEEKEELSLIEMNIQNNN